MPYCGIILKGDEDEDCALAFITEDGVRTYSTADDEEIMGYIEEHRPEVIALNAPQEHRPQTAFYDPVTEGNPEQPNESKDDEKDDEDTEESESPLHPETAKLYRSGEEELIKEGYSILPQEMRNRRLLERAEFLCNSIKRSGVGSTIIESNPGLVAKKLGITGDRQLEAYGVDTSDVENVYEFDALLLALTARFYAEDEYEDKDIILPKSLDERH